MPLRPYEQDQIFPLPLSLNEWGIGTFMILIGMSNQSMHGSIQRLKQESKMLFAL